MAETTPRGIQATLFDYFQDTEYFSIEDAKELVIDHQKRDVNRESIRARIYEGIDKGLFERVGKGLYKVTRQDEQGRENTCLLINGDGRDLSFLPDNSVDALITDHPYDTSKSLKGRNRNFADYELFQYTEEDFREKLRVLKPGSFLVEFLPEENGDNYEYLFRVKDMARKAGFEYYAKVPWKKGDFVANTGRKSKNTEDVCFFTKGHARDLRRNAQKDKAYENSREIVTFKEFIPGATTVSYNGMGSMGSSSQTDIGPIHADIRVSVDKKDASRAKDLIERAWDEASMLEFDRSPLLDENGGEYALEQLFDMPQQQYILRCLEAFGLQFVDLSFGPENIFDAAKFMVEPGSSWLWADGSSKNHVIVNPTNLIGPMGAGLAKEFRDRYPGLEETYKEACRQRQFCGTLDGYRSTSDGGNEILISESRAMFEGNLFMYSAEGRGEDVKVLCFPTKRHWKDPSDLGLIEAGLKTFVQNYHHLNIGSITFPKLGCGLGGLDWEKEVKPLMQKYLGNLPDIEVFVCGDTLKEDRGEHFMSGAAGMLPTVFDIPCVSKKDKIHQAEKPVALLEQILRFVTKEDELVVDQFAGSGSLGEAALNAHRNSVLIEKDPERFEKMTQRLQVLGSIEAVSPAAATLLTLGADAIAARNAFMQTGERDFIYDFVKKHEMPDPAVLYQGEKELWDKGHLSVEQKDAVSEALNAIKDIDLRSTDLDLGQSGQGYLQGLVQERMEALGEANVHVESQVAVLQAAADAIEAHAAGPDAYAAFVKHQNESGMPMKELAHKLWMLPEDQSELVASALAYAKMIVKHEAYPRVLECSSRGDKRFSPLYANVTIRGKERSIEEWYQDSKRTADGKKAGKGKPFDHIVDPFTGDKLPKVEHMDLYRGLWITYLSKNPELVKYAEQFDAFSNFYAKKGIDNGYHEVIDAYVKSKSGRYVEVVKCSKWYKNMERKLTKPGLAQQSLDSQIQNAVNIGGAIKHENVRHLADKER